MSTQFAEQQTPPPAETALAVWTGSSRDPLEITERLEQGAERGHLISPMSQCGNLPPFCEVAFTPVQIDAEVDKDSGFPVRPGEIYMIAKNQYGLAKTALNKLKRAIAVKWDPTLSGRIDDQSDPYYVKWFSFGYVQKFDGTMDTIKGTKTFDLRDGSAKVESMIAKKVNSAILKLEYDARAKNYRVTDDKIRKAQEDAEARAWDDVREKRANIEELAETGSEMRALRSLGLKTSYTLAELKRPFYVASLMVTGRHENPEYERMFAEKAADQFLNVRANLFGPQTAPAPAALPAPMREAPPPVGTFIDADEEDDEDLERGAVNIEASHVDPGPEVGSIDEAARQSEANATRVEAEQVSREAQSRETEQSAPATTSAQTAQAAKVQETAVVYPFGEHKGKYLDDSSIDDESIEFVLDWVTGALADPKKAQFKSTNTLLQKSLQIEQRRRKAARTGGNAPRTASAPQNRF